MSDPVLSTLISVFASISVCGIGALFIRKKTQAETEGIVVEQFNKLVNTQNQLIEKNERKIKELELSNDDCEYRHEVAKLEIHQLKKMMDFSHLPRATAFVLDDNKMVIIEFQKHFKEISVLDCRTYTSPTMFLKDAQIGKPEIVILDYYIDKDLTAEQIINDLGYSPEVFIMSQDKDIQVRIKEKGYDFFYKDDHYVSKIARAVVQYLIDKN